MSAREPCEVRLFYVERRDRATLLPIIERECRAKSVIHSDEWKAYSNLNSLRFRHNTVRHKEKYVDPETGAHTQGIEQAWLDAKASIIRAKIGVPVERL